jgi:hypothetical protein
MHPAYFETRFKLEGHHPSWPSEFAILTAYETTGEHWSAQRNSDADKELESFLKAARVWLLRITGYSPITNHCEPGWAVALPFHAACDIGLRFKQDAIYFVKGDELTVTYCDPSQRAPVPAGSFRQRLE